MGTGLYRASKIYAKAGFLDLHLTPAVGAKRKTAALDPNRVTTYWRMVVKIRSFLRHHQPPLKLPPERCRKSGAKARFMRLTFATRLPSSPFRSTCLAGGCVCPASVSRPGLELPQAREHGSRSLALVNRGPTYYLPGVGKGSLGLVSPRPFGNGSSGLWPRA